MTNITELKDAVNVETTKFVLLSIATLGVYNVLWLWRQSPKIASITNANIFGDTFFIWVAVCLGWSPVLQGTGDLSLDMISLLIVIANSVLYIVWAFKAKAALESYALNEHRINLRLNAFYTFLFNLYYINYCINDLPEEKAKQDILAGHQPASSDS